MIQFIFGICWPPKTYGVFMRIPTLTTVCKRVGNGTNHYILYVGCKPPPRMPVKNEGLVLSSWLVMIESWGGKATPKIKGDPMIIFTRSHLHVRRQPFIFAKYPRHPKSSHTWWGWVWKGKPLQIAWGVQTHTDPHIRYDRLGVYTKNNTFFGVKPSCDFTSWFTPKLVYPKWCHF